MGSRRRVAGAQAPWALLLPLAAFGGGLATTLIVYHIASRDGRTDVAIMLLAAFNRVDLPNILTNGGPGTATESLSLHAYIRWRTNVAPVIPAASTVGKLAATCPLGCRFRLAAA